MIKFNQKKIDEIAQKYNLKLLLLFGSQVTGKTHKFSDYDFGFLAKYELDNAKRFELNEKLIQLVKNRNVEDVDLAKAGPLLLKEIIKNNQILFQDDFEYENFFSYAVRTYIEARRIFDLNEILYKNTVLKYKQKIHG